MKGELPPVRPFELDPRAGRFETVEETPELPAELAPQPVPPARPFWRRPGLLLVGSIIGLVLLQAIDYVTGLIETTPLLGWPFAVLLAVVVVTALGTLWKEVFDLRRVRRAERLRLTGQRLAGSELHGEAVGYLDDLDQQLGERHKAEIRAASERGLDDSEVLSLYERQVLAPRDKRAYRLVLEASRDIGLLTALSPLGLMDGLLVLWRATLMIRGIARAYGLALGSAAAFNLLRRCIRNAAIAGLADVVSHAAVEHVGASLAALLSARAGQGAGNALLAGRLGLEAIRLTRPLPFIAEPPPRLSHVRAAIFEPGGKIDPVQTRPERGE
ncbi:MAG: TIGR01620 family protein [Geminicoccaceae bacterium]